MTLERQKEIVAGVAEAARQFLKVYDEFDGDPSCVGECFDALAESIWKMDDSEIELLSVK